MFENAYIGVDDKNGNPIKNGDKVLLDIEGYRRIYQIIYDQESCSFVRKQLGLPFTLKETILSFIMCKHYVVLNDNPNKER